MRPPLVTRATRGVPCADKVLRIEFPLSAEQPRIDLGTEHPLAAVATIMLKPTGEAEIVGIDGRVLRVNMPRMPGVWAVASTVFDVATSTLRLVLHDDTEFVTEIGTAMSFVDRPVVYLDQNHWIDLARARVSSPKISGERKFACERLIELARTREVILPLSGAHIVETAKRGGLQRTDLAQTMIELSRGWQMRSPMRVRAHELKRMLELGNPTTSRWPDIDVFTLLPNAIWADHHHTALPRFDLKDLPDEVRGLTERVTWAVALTELLLETDSDFSPEGYKIATTWAKSFHDLAQHMRSNPKAKAHARDLSRTRFITDMSKDITQAASDNGLSPEQFGRWLADDAETALAAAPALGRIREVIHMRLSNADDKWEANDLNDLLYLATAGACADVLVGEKKTCSYLRRAQGAVSPGGAVFHRMTDALPAIELLIAQT